MKFTISFVITLFTTTRAGSIKAGIVDSEDLQTYDAHRPFSVAFYDEPYDLHSLNWHEGKVFALVEVPEEGIPIPFSPASFCKLSETTCDGALW
jgi:hypothetical protein